MNRIAASVLLFFWITADCPAQARAPFHITHQYANTNAQSLIGLPMGSHKTVVDMKGNLRWSQWNLRRRPLDAPFGFSAQMDGALHIEILAALPGEALTPLLPMRQELHKNRFPFVVTHLAGKDLRAEELAFSVESGGMGMDVVRIQLDSSSDEEVSIEIRLSGKRRNLPGHAREEALVTRDGYLIALGQAATGTFGSAAEGLALIWRGTLPKRSRATVWLKAPYDFSADREQFIAQLSGTDLLEAAEGSWKTLWNRGLRLELPVRELEDFYYASMAYVLILTERDAAGDLWAIDGPGGYRQFWGRGEYFQARAMEVGGHVDIARQTAEHTLRLQMDDGEWAGPPISGYPAWDNIGGNAGAVWDCYRFTGDRSWLEKAYPYLLAAARWIQLHREETQLPSSGSPPGAAPIRRQLPWNCRPEPNPPLAPGEKPYWWGLLPWGYGDSGLPEGHGFPHNFMALYAIQCAHRAATELGHTEDARRLSAEFEDYKAAIMTSIERALTLEKDEAPYLPAMPTYPDAAVSQSFLAVHPAGLFSPNHPLVTGLLDRMERTELQGLPTNMAWMGFAGVWPGQSLNVAEIYLRRGALEKTIRLLTAALEHSYTTKVWKEEIAVDPSRPLACLDSAPVSRRWTKGDGNGDMPEAWANANLVNLVRDMLLYEEGGVLKLLHGIPSTWIDEGLGILVEKAPTTLGGEVSFRLNRPTAGRMILELTPPPVPVNVLVRFPLGAGQAIRSVRVNGQAMRPISESVVRLDRVSQPSRIEIELHSNPE